MVFADGHTASNAPDLPTSEVKWHRARLVLGWGTAWEDLRVLSAFCLFYVTDMRIGGLLLCVLFQWQA